MTGETGTREGDCREVDGEGGPRRGTEEGDREGAGVRDRGAVPGTGHGVRGMGEWEWVQGGGQEWR